MPRRRAAIQPLQVLLLTANVPVGLSHAQRLSEGRPRLGLLCHPVEGKRLEDTDLTHAATTFLLRGKLLIRRAREGCARGANADARA
jgi:hypothetical protein